MSKIGDLTGYEVVDAEGAYVGPGLVDIHTHAADGHWFFEEPELAAKHMLEHGATTVLPTLYFNMNGAAAKIRFPAVGYCPAAIQSILQNGYDVIYGKITLTAGINRL